jgi:Sec-independent protein translocase protein TatA
MFGVGPQELLIIVLLMLVVFGPSKAVNMARDLGRFVSETRSQVEEFKDELLDDDEVDGDDPTSDPHSGGAGDDVAPQQEELTQGEEVPPAQVRDAHAE